MTADSGRLRGKVALISGAARGQGAAHARRFAEEGARVFAGDVLDDAGEASAAAMRDSGLDVRYLHLDVTLTADWDRAVDRVESEHGRLDLLVNNAGVLDDMTGAADLSESEWDRVAAVNQKGVFLGMKAAIPAMRRVGGGAIVNVSSVYGVGGVAGYFAYQASKGAVILMTKSAALTYGRDGIRVNSVCPGAISTPMLEAEDPDEIAALIASLPIQRAAEPTEVSHAVLFLCSDEASYITGVALPVDGGYLARG